MAVHYGDPDLIWIGDAVSEYGRHRNTLDRLIDDGTIHPVKFAGDRRIFLRRSELDAKINKPIQDVPDNQVG